MKKIFLIVLLMLSIDIVYADMNVYRTNNADETCNAIASEKLKIYVYNPYTKENTRVKTNPGECRNTEYYAKNLANVTDSSYNSWIWVRRTSPNDNYYIEGKLQRQSDYKHIIIGNRVQKFDANTGKLQQDFTLKPGEKINLYLDISDRPVKKDSDELRLSINYGILDGGDKDIAATNSIGYYVYDKNNKEYGPYRLEYATLENKIRTSGTSNITIEYKLISENLMKNIATNTDIVGIKIVPYDFHNTHGGYFKLYKLSLDKYTNYNNGREKIQLTNAESKIRHEIVDNMALNATIKWKVSNQSNTVLNFYHNYIRTTPQVFSGSSDKIYYGLPYVNTVYSTIETFEDKAPKDNSGINSYVLTNKYLENATASNGTTITGGSAIANNNLYVYETEPTNDLLPTRANNLANYSYIPNTPGYFYGVDCTHSTMLAIGQEVPYLHHMMTAYYQQSYQVKMPGGLTISTGEVETAVRENNRVKQNEEFTYNTLLAYYPIYIDEKYGSEKMYNEYGLLRPGDVVSKMGHTRLISGFSYVVCNDDTVFSKGNYKSNSCSEHGGINGSKSYAVITEITTGHSVHKDRLYCDMTGTESFVPESTAGWVIHLNSDYTDLTKISDTLNVSSSFYVNIRYYFDNLYSGGSSSDEDPIDAGTAMYIPARFIEVNKLASTNTIEKPVIKLINESTYDDIKESKVLKGNIISNYMINGVKYEINGQTYYDHPQQTNNYSLYYDIDNAIKNKISSLNYNSSFSIKVSVKTGPTLDEVKAAFGSKIDSEGYITVLNINSNYYFSLNSNYKIDTNKKYIYSLNNNITINSLNQNINTTGTIAVSNNNTVKQGNEYIFTGDIANISYSNSLYNDSYTLVIRGDVDGNGKANKVDSQTIANQILNNNIITSGPAMAAADYNDDGSVKMNDAMRIIAAQ